MDYLPLIYCSKCQEKTKTNNVEHAMSKTNRPMLKGECAVCFTRKSTFVKMNRNKKEDEFSGTYSD